MRPRTKPLPARKARPCTNLSQNFPCTQCVRSNLHCVASSRKPRARHSGKRAVDSELRNRISKLENLVENLSGDVALATDGPSMNGAGQVAETKGAASPAVRKYIGSQFWSTLTGEVQALKDALEDDQTEDEQATSPSSASGPSNSAEYELLVCPPGMIYVMPGALPEPSPQASAVLFDAFCSNVDRISKIYHTPSLQAFMIEGKPYLGHDPSTPGNNAVKAAIWFAASNTLSEDECQMMFGKSRYAQSQIFRKMVDIALAQADLFTTSDLATLQALTTYTVSPPFPASYPIPISRCFPDHFTIYRLQSARMDHGCHPRAHCSRLRTSQRGHPAHPFHHRTETATLA